MNKKVKKTLMTLLRAVIGYGVAFYFLRKLFNKDMFLTEVRGGNVWLFGLALLGFGTVLLLSFVRWKKLMDVLGVHLKFVDVCRLGMIGTFFNSSLPGAVSGDFVKMVYIRHHAPTKLTESILTIMLDRIFGMFGLLAVAFLACMMNLNYLLNADQQIQVWTFGMGIASAGGVVAVLALLFKGTLVKIPGVPACIELGRRILPDRVVTVLDRIICAMDLYRNNFSAVVYVIGISIVSHLILAGVLLSLGHAIHINGVPVTRYVLAASMGNAVSSIPITPGSFGIRDTVSKIFLEQAGAPVAKANVAPILVTCIMAFWSIVGGLFYVVGLAGPHREDLKDDPATKNDDPVESA